jgi:hypothetical protein
VCGYDTPFPLAFEKVCYPRPPCPSDYPSSQHYVPDVLKLIEAIKRTVHF